MKEYCTIATVGEASLHRKWLGKSDHFDLHLIVYDDSYETFKFDTRFVTRSKGNKFKLIYDYLVSVPHILNHYKYFYMPDDDILINSDNIHKLFKYMEYYKLAAAQPALSNSYFSHAHLLRHLDSKMRFTNFIEIMQPCFSAAALKKVLFTFNESRSGWGIDYHWGRILDYGQMNMAVVDDVISVHTRPVKSSHFEELDQYLKKYDLSTEIYST